MFLESYALYASLLLTLHGIKDGRQPITSHVINQPEGPFNGSISTSTTKPNTHSQETGNINPQTTSKGPFTGEPPSPIPPPVTSVGPTETPTGPSVTPSGGHSEGGSSSPSNRTTSPRNGPGEAIEVER